MSYELFPALPGLSWGVIKAPMWSTTIQRSASGKEVRTSFYDRPIWNFQLVYEFLRGSNGRAEFQTLVAFYNRQKGAFESFLFTDPTDCQADGQQFGIGDGVNRSFVLVHSIGGWVEPVGYAGAPAIKVDGASTSAYTTDGVTVTFAAAPPPGAILTWTGGFQYRVRFAKDTLEFEEFQQDFWSAKKVELLGVI